MGTETIIFFNDSVNISNLDNYSFHIIEQYPNLNAATISAEDTESLETMYNDNVIDLYQENCEVFFSETEPIIEKNITLDDDKVDVPNDWGYLHVNSKYANDHGLDGTDIKVAIFDTGIDADHEYLKDNFAGFTDIVYGQETAYDDFGHGTHCAGIVKTVAPEVSLYGYKVHDRRAFNKLSNILKGLDVIVEDGMDVVNMSFTLITEYEREGYPMEEAKKILNEACSRTVAQGVFLVAASGNQNLYPDPDNGRSMYAPANCPDVFAVGASSDKEDDPLAQFTNLGFDIVAPGDEILSSIPNNEYASYSGTSMATPFIVGAIAAVKSKYPNLENDEIKQLLVDFGDHYTSHRYRGDIEYDILNMKSVTDALERLFF